MKSSKIRGGLVLAVAVLLSTAAFAGSKPGSLYLSEGAQLNGRQIPAGTYQLRWEGNGPAVQVSVLKGKKVIASAPAKIEQVAAQSDRGAAVIDTAGGSRTLVEARFAGKNYKLVFPSPEAQAQNMHTGSNQSNR
jgi:hypothetical protein